MSDGGASRRGSGFWAGPAWIWWGRPCPRRRFCPPPPAASRSLAGSPSLGLDALSWLALLDHRPGQWRGGCAGGRPDGRLGVLGDGRRVFVGSPKLCVEPKGPGLTPCLMWSLVMPTPSGAVTSIEASSRVRLLSLWCPLLLGSAQRGGGQTWCPGESLSGGAPDQRW